MKHVPLTSVRPDPGQPRKDFEREPLEELAASIAAMGIAEPLVVRPDPDRRATYLLVAGERRWRAAGMAGLDTVPVIVRKDLDDRAARILQMVENVVRRDMNPIEEAEGYRALVEDGLSVEDIAQRTGKKERAIRMRLGLLNLTPAIREMVAKRQLTAFDGSQLATLSDEGQWRAWRAIEQGGLTGADRARVIGRIWTDEQQATMFEAPGASEIERTRKVADLRTLVEQACAAVSRATAAADGVKADHATIEMAEMLERQVAALVRQTRLARVDLLLDQMTFENLHVGA